MVEKLRTSVQVPVWIISLCVPLMITILLVVVESTRKQAETTGSIKTSIIEMNKRLDRIEIKFDNHVK